MKVVERPLAPELAPAAPAAAPTRLADYLTLTRPRIAVMALFTVAVGVLLASGRNVQPAVLLHTLLGTALVAAGASALNQWLERASDARMRRTENRPLPAGRLQPLEVAVFGGVLGLVGVAYLALALPHPWAAVVAAVTFVSYVGVYTPLKAVTPWNTLVGAVPGALPPVIGWCAARGELTADAVSLFLIVFLWQVPHFLAIAWIYRADYARAGLRMLPAVDRTGGRTAGAMTAFCVALVPVSLGPVFSGSAGWVYVAGAVPLGLLFLVSARRFARDRTDLQARQVLRTSLVYLPGLLACLLLDAVVGSQLSVVRGRAAPVGFADNGELTTDNCDFPVPEFRLTERSGKVVTRSDLLGKVWVASFVFTRCTGPCPQVTGTIARLQSELANEPDVRFVTFTVDPARDNPDELKRYAEHFRADPERWLFLTGEEKDVHRLLKEGFLVPVARSGQANPPPGQEFDHSTRLAVVDRRGNIRGYFSGVRDLDDPGADPEFEANLRKLRETVAALAREKP
jgi:protoheme IX farnesyltransferase